MENYKEYINPLIERYASREMSFIFSPYNKFTTWRKLWLALAETERELGLEITEEQLNEMRSNIEKIDLKRAAELESQLRHDVMAHIHLFGECCPNAKPIIHLGATSAFVGDNTDLIQMRDGFKILAGRLNKLISNLREFAIKYARTPTLGFTHFQPAQLTTVGKRTSLWIYDLLMDTENVLNFIEKVPFRGVKGTTGTQASFLALFNGDHEKVKKLDREVSRKMGFENVLPVTGQTYTRKIDSWAASIICGIAQSLHKMTNDIRLLQSLKEIEEPFEKSQVGSSAMAYKRNPMRSERVASLCRYIISLSTSPVMTASEQWFERTLDDSANKRLSIPEMFLAADASLIIANNISKGLVVYEKIIEKHIREELPFMTTENIIMACVKKGKDRQELHERIRKYSMIAANAVKNEGKENNLLQLIVADPYFELNNEEIEKILKVEDFIGRAPEQVFEFIEEYVEPILKRTEKIIKITEGEVKV